jgi:hypothetical protein
MFSLVSTLPLPRFCTTPHQPLTALEACRIAASLAFESDRIQFGRGRCLVVHHNDVSANRLTGLYLEAT